MFKDSALLEVRDIEQLAMLGKQMKACPYFGTRKSVPEAEVMVNCWQKYWNIFDKFIEKFVSKLT